jgi:aldehyde:ferredoxin oxidoreductase
MVERCSTKRKPVKSFEFKCYPTSLDLSLKKKGRNVISGYAGRIAWIDLAKEKVSIEKLDEGIARKYLGGKGLGAYLLYNNISPNTEPYGPKNNLIFITGPLTGTTFPGAARSGVITKSPMTGTFLDTYAGGFFGPHIKRNGFDAVVITGKAKIPVYLLIEGGEISIKEADYLWGLSCSQTEDQLRRELESDKQSKVSVAAIGQAGEQLVRFANIITQKRAYGRGGAGAVMGSKNLKAIAIRGDGKLQIANQKAYKEVEKRCRKNIAEHPLTRKGGDFPSLGTWRTVDLTQYTGTLPTRNWQEDTFQYAEEINADAFKRHEIRSRACFGCPIGCSRDTRALVGDIEFFTEGPDYETIFAFGSNCEIKDPGIIIAADKLCDDYGIDTISCGGVIGFAMECFEKSLISEKDTGGLDLSFGNGDALIEVIHLIARREGIGRLLSEGVKIASEQITGSCGFAIQVKGLEFPGYDPRGMKGQGLTYALSDRGACHVRSNTLRTELMGRPYPLDQYAYEGKAAMVRELQLDYATYDCLIACIFGAFAITSQDYADALAAVTGWPMTQAELRLIAERAWNLTRLFNAREGFTRKDDTLPERIFSEAPTKGPSNGQVMDRASFEKMLDEYYEIVGWDKRTGIPTDEKLRELGIGMIG